MAGGDIEEPLILHHILSFLPTEEAAKTSLFSKAWLDAWRTRPTLEFDDGNLFRILKRSSAAANPSARGRFRAHQRVVRKFSRYMKTTMRRYSNRKIRINTLKLRLVWGDISKSVIRESIRIAVENNVRTLDIYLPLCRNALGGKVNVFGGESIVNLKLRECELRTVSVDQIRCHNIERLDFYMVYFDELTFENIIDCCPLLKLLKIGRVWRVDEETGDYHTEEDGPRVFRVKKHSNLQEIDFELFKFQSLILGELPRLDSLVCTNDESYLEELQDISVDWMPCNFSLYSSRYRNLNTLVLSAVGIGDGFFNNFAYMFPNVEDLSIQYCHNVQTLKLSSQSIKRFGLGENRELKEAHFDLPRIVYFKFRSAVEFAPILSFTALSGGWVSSLYIDCGYGYEVPSLWFRKLKAFLSGLYQSEILLRIMLLEIPEFNGDEIKNMFASSKPVMIEELSLNFSQKESTSSTLSILDSIFWICRPRIIIYQQGLGDIFCMKLLYKILVLKRNQDQTRFWQIDLKDVHVGTFKKDVSRGFGNRIQQRRTCISFCSLNVYNSLEMGDNVLDWEGFLVLSRSIAGAEGICFKLGWRGLQKESLTG